MNIFPYYITLFHDNNGSYYFYPIDEINKTGAIKQIGIQLRFKRNFNCKYIILWTGYSENINAYEDKIICMLNNLNTSAKMSFFNLIKKIEKLENDAKFMDTSTAFSFPEALYDVPPSFNEIYFGK